MLAPMTQFTMTAEALPAMPLIGVTGRVDRGGPSLPNVVGDALMEMFFTDFPSKIRAAGGQPILLSIHSDPRRIVEHLDALVLSGGSDVDPRRYGRTPGPNSSIIDPARDEFEFALVDAAWEIGLPILGVCRGHQVVNVARGGTLIADLPTDAGEAHSFFGYPRSYRPQQVALESGSVPHSLFGNSIHVNSLHHQAVDTPGSGLRIVGRALDGVAEAIQAADRPVVGVQWHPEFFVEIDPLFSWLVDAATSRRTDSSHQTDHHRMEDNNVTYA